MEALVLRSLLLSFNRQLLTLIGRDVVIEDFADLIVYQESGRPAMGLDHIIRGGSWHSDAIYCRAASRKWNGPSSGLPFVGFRLALAPRKTP